MTGIELVRKLRKLAQENGIPFSIDKSRGKGSHVTLKYGDHWAIAPKLSRELYAGTLANIVKALCIDRRRL